MENDNNDFDYEHEERLHPEVRRIIAEKRLNEVIAIIKARQKERDKQKAKLLTKDECND